VNEPAWTILIVDDDPSIRKFLRISLDAQGYRVREASGGVEALRQATTHRPDLVVLDLGLPDIDGQEVISQLRDWYHGPVIVLSVRADEQEKVRALDGGANDYVTKPFGIAELVARIRALLRNRTEGQCEPVFHAGELKVDLARREVWVSGELIKLSRKEYAILKLLILHAGQVLTHQHLLREVWGAAHVEETHYLRVFIGHLRAKLKDDPARPRYIVTEQGVGYRLRAES